MPEIDALLQPDVGGRKRKVRADRGKKRAKKSTLARMEADFNSLPTEDQAVISACLERFTGAAWRPRGAKRLSSLRGSGPGGRRRCCSLPLRCGG
jgi:hypothetical protein